MSREVMQQALDALNDLETATDLKRLFRDRDGLRFDAIVDRASFALAEELKKSEPEPVAYAVLGGREIESGGWEYIASWAEACHEHINNAIAEYDVYDAGEWRVVPLYRKENV